MISAGRADDGGRLPRRIRSVLPSEITRPTTSDDVWPLDSKERQPGRSNRPSATMSFIRRRIHSEHCSISVLGLLGEEGEKDTQSHPNSQQCHTRTESGMTMPNWKGPWDRGGGGGGWQPCPVPIRSSVIPSAEEVLTLPN